MQTTGRPLSQYDFSDSWLLEMQFLPTEIVLDCELRVVTEKPGRTYQHVRLRLAKPRALRLDFTFPKIAPPESADDLGSIDRCDISGSMGDAAVQMESSYGRISTDGCALTVEVLGQPERAEP